MTSKKDNLEDFTPSSAYVPDYSFAQEISTATVVKLLVSKGILSLQEILEEEKKTRSHSIINPATTKDKTGHQKNHGIRKLASKYRWSRRVTSLIFGWQWKKSKTVLDTAKSPEE